VDLEVWTHDSYVVVGGVVGMIVVGVVVGVVVTVTVVIGVVVVVEDDSEILDSILRWRGYMTLRFLCSLGIRWWLFDMGRNPSIMSCATKRGSKDKEIKNSL